jgi:ribonuclease G
MKKELFFDRHGGLLISALAENGILTELNIENEFHKDIVGNIYKGRVVNVIESMNAAFVACGLERNCYLSLAGTETSIDPTKYDSKYSVEKKTLPLKVKVGDEIVVQVLKNPRGTKGAKVTTKLAFVGKNLIFLPKTDFLGISRRIKEDELRQNLLFMVDGMRGRGNGLIVRTVAPYATSSRLQSEVKYLKNLYADVLEKKKTAPVGGILYREAELPIRVLRDSFNEDIEKIVVGEEELYERLVKLMKMRSDFDVKDIELYQGERDMLSRYQLSKQIKELSDAHVELPNGGNLVIERTEALTVIDVNTGRYIGDENLEDTVYATNIAAAREVARQVRLRDIGGIVVVDFIDMADERHRKAVTAELEQSLEADRTKCKIMPMNDLCLVEFVRQRTTNGVASQLLQPCTHCKQSGYVFSNEFIVYLLRTEIQDRLAQGAKCVVAEMNSSVMEYLLDRKMLDGELGHWQEREIYLVPHGSYHEEHFFVTSYASAKMAGIPREAVRLC